MKESSKRILFAAGILTVGILLQVLYLTEFSTLPVMKHVAGADVSEYYTEAKQILHGQWAVDPDSIHGALYSFFLAAFLFLAGGDLWWTRMIQGTFFLTGMLSAFYLLLRAVSEKSAEDGNCSVEEKDGGTLRYLPECGCLIVALYAPLVIYRCDFFSENLMITLLLWSLYLLYRKGAVFCGAGGLSCGLALTAHAGGIFFVPAAALYCYFRERPAGKRKAFLHSGAFLLGVLIIVAPLSLYKSIKSSRFVLLQKNSMFNVFLGNNPESTGTCYLSPGIRWEAEFQKADQVCAEQEIHRETYFRNRILLFLWENPCRFAAGLLKKGCMALSAREFTTWSDVTSLKKILFHAWGYHGWFLALLLLGGPFLITGCFRADRRRSLAPLLILFAAGFCSQVFFITSGRYRLLLVFPLAAAGGGFLCSWYRDLKSPWKGLPLFAVTFLLFGISIYPYRISMQPERDYARSLLADALLRSGDPGGVLALYQEESSGSVFPERCLALKGRACMELNRLSEAQKYFELCAQQFPLQAEHWMNLSAVHSKKGDFERAAQYLYRARQLKLTPARLADLEYNLGEIFQRCRRMDYAEKQYRKALEINPIHRKALNNLGTLLLLKRPPEPDQALACFRKSVSLEGDNPDLRVNMALAYIYKGDKDGALKILEEVLAGNEHHSRAARLKAILQNDGK